MAPTIPPDAPLGVACLGITHPHASGRVKAFGRMDHVRMLGAHDDSPLLGDFADAMGLEVRTRADILADPDVHAVLVHSKSARMAELTIEALEAGKSVLCEKPAGRGSADTARIVDAVERTGGHVQVGYCWRYSPAVERMQQVLDEGLLGRVVQVRAHAGCSHSEAGTSHMMQPGDIGGALFVIGCHTIDRILLHFGMPDAVNARISKFPGVGPEEAREDAGGAILTYPDKLLTLDFMSWDPLPWTESWDLTAYGTNGIMHSRPLPASYKLYLDDRDGRQAGWTEWNETSFPEIWAVRKTVYSPELAEIGNPVYFDREAATFVRNIRGGHPSNVSAQHAHRVNLLLETLFRSAAAGGAEIRMAPA